MKKQIIPVLFCAAVALFTTACNGKKDVVAESHEGTDLESHEEKGVTFKEGKGLHVSEKTATFIGLKTEDVTEEKITSVVTFEASVYRAARNAKIASQTGAGSRLSFASGMLSTDDASKVKGGKRLQIVGNGKQILIGQVAEINALGGTNSHGREVIISIEDPEHQLTEGDAVHVSVRLGDERDSVVIPASSLLQTAEGSFVYTVNGDRFVRTPIKVSSKREGKVEVSEGLYSGDQIVTDPVMTLWMAELQSIRGGKACADGH